MSIEAPLRTRSIGARLTLLYTLTALAAVALFAGVAVWRLSANFSAEHLRFLQAKVAEFQNDMRDAHERPQALVVEILKETTESRLREYQARVIAPNGHLLGETPGMHSSLPQDVFPPAVREAPLDALKTLHVGNHRYVLTSVSLEPSVSAAHVDVQIALDTTRDDRLLTDLRRAMTLTFLVLIPLLTLAGRWVSARGLAPLTRIARAARAVTPASLSGRIPATPPWPQELEELVQVFNAMLARIDEAFARLSRFSADLAHELRTPLSNLRGEIEVCLMNPRDAEEYRATLESGLEECRRLNAIIENLLFLARAEHAVLALHRERFDVVQACEQVIAQHAAGAAKRGIVVRTVGNADLDADLLLFRQALSNLLGNAVRHSPVDGEVSIRVHASGDGGVEVRVRDHGQGIEARHLPHLFDRFYQADASRHRGDGTHGAGLGLSIVKTIIELHGGAVWLESAPGAGTTAVMRFPARVRPSSEMT